MITGVVLFVLGTVGAALCRLILLYHAGDRRVRKKFCGGTGRYDCDRLVAGKRPKLAVLGWIYWVAQTLFLVLESIEGHSGGLATLFFSCVAAAVLALFLIGYQAVRKTWCRMCLLVAGIVFIQLGVILALGTLNTLPPIGSFVLYGFCWAVAAGWYFFNAPRQERVRRHIIQRELTFFKSDPQVLRTLLKRQKVVDAQRWADDLFLGNPAAPVQLLAVLNSNCSPCAEAQAQLLKLAATWPKAVGVAIRFKAQSDQPDLVQRHAQWRDANGITGMPAIFINGRELPEAYTVRDLTGLIPGMPPIK
jgi:hypothetical protein